MKKRMPIYLTINEDYRGLKKGTVFDFEETKFILDDNGTGKSTLLKGIMSAHYGTKNLEINNPTPEGTIDWMFKNIPSLKIGYFGQDSNLKTLGYLSDENISLSVSSLQSSSGESAFVQLIELIKNNHIILLDEPATSLSISNILRLVYLIQKLEGEKTFIIVEHNETFLKHFKKDLAYKVNGDTFLVKDYIKEQYRKFEDEMN